MKYKKLKKLYTIFLINAIIKEYIIKEYQCKILMIKKNFFYFTLIN